MAEADKYYPKQMNGPVISAYAAARNEELSDAGTIENYLYRLSIDTARESELENIGRIIGYLRPLVPVGFNEENIFLIGNTPIQTDRLTGFADTGGSIGGNLTSVERTDSSFMRLGTYRKFLKSIAVLQRYGLTLYAIDRIASAVSMNYEISWQENGDILLHFTEQIGYKSIWILTQLFYRIATSPQVVVTSSSEQGE